ncbi:hypothetical protein Hanom_Chr17g01552181 [Helianthus anomalus]
MPAALVLKSGRRTKATRSKTEGRSAKRKSSGLFVPEAQANYIYFSIYPLCLAFHTQNIAISMVFV